jgi:hypothetical protein
MTPPRKSGASGRGAHVGGRAIERVESTVLRVGQHRPPVDDPAGWAHHEPVEREAGDELDTAAGLVAASAA